MAIFEDKRELNAVKFISKLDSAVDKEASDREAYEEDIIANADKLVLIPGEEPTIFLLNLELKAKDMEEIENSQSDGINPLTKRSTMTVGSWANTVCKIVLKDIQNPPGVKGIEFKKDGRGHVDVKVMDKLANLGIVQEIFQQYVALRHNKDEVKREAKNS